MSYTGADAFLTHTNTCYNFYVYNFILTADPGDKEFPMDKPVYVVWALGRLDKTNNEPSFHDLYPRGDVVLELNRKEAENACIDFTETSSKLPQKCENLMFLYFIIKLRFSVLISSLFSENLGRKQK